MSGFEVAEGQNHDGRETGNLSRLQSGAFCVADSDPQGWIVGSTHTGIMRFIR